MRHSAAARPAEKGNQLEAIKREVLAILERYQIRLTPKDLFKALQKKPNTPPMQTIRLAVKQLLQMAISPTRITITPRILN